MKKYSTFLIIAFIVLVAMIISCFIPIKANKLIPTIEEQVSKDIGAKVHIEKLILRTGPYLKLKAPVMHVLYEDGQKFAQFDGIKFYIPWHALLKNTPEVSYIDAKRLTVRFNSDDKCLNDLIDKNKSRNIISMPNIQLKSYKISYNNKDDKNIYTLEGQNLILNRLRNYRNFKVSSTGTLSIGNVKYINYDISLVPNLNLPENFSQIDFIKYLEQIKDLDFHSDIITDLKLYKNTEGLIEASGFVNIDNISVLDFAKKNPKSFAYLTLWGDKASILSNIYTSASQKIYIEGMLNNSKKPTLELKVKTDEILLSDLHKKLKILSNFSFLKTIEELNGKFVANFSVKGDLNKIKSNGFIKVTDALIVSDGVKIEKINSDIDLSNNKINIKKAIGYVNKTPISAKGYIDKIVDIQLILNNVNLKHLCPKSIGVESGIINLIANFKGEFGNLTHKEILNIDNLKINSKNLNLTVESIDFNSNKNNIAYIKNVICNTKETDSIKIPSIRLLVDKNAIKIPETNAFMANSKIAFTSSLENINSKKPTINFDGYGYINSKDLTRFNNKSLRYPIKIQVNGTRLSNIINSQLLVENTELFDEPTLVNLNVKFDKKSLKIDDLSLLSFSGKFQNDLKNNQKGQRKVIVTGLIDDIKEPNFKNIRLFIPQQLCLHILDSIIQLKGDTFINGKYNHPDIVGQIYINNLHNQALQLNLTNTVLDFNKNLIQFNAPLIKFADSSISATGNVSTNFTNGINISGLNIKSKYLNTDTFLMYKDSSITKGIPVTINDGKFYSEKILANIYDTALYFYAFSSDIFLKNNIISLKNISSEIFNGKLAGKINYNLRDEHYDIDIMTRGVSAEPIFNIISSRKDNISGTMDFDALLKGELTSKQSLNGNIKFVVNNGRMSSLGKLEHLLYAQNVIADNMLRTSLSVVTKAITLKDTGLFKFLRGDITLENGIANINMLQSQGPLMALFIKGKFNPIDNCAKLVVLGRLSDEIVNGLGAFGDFSFNKLLIMLTGEESKTNILPEDFDKIPQLSMKNTKEFRSIINGNIDKASSVLLFNWISYSQKILKQKEVPMLEVEVPKFIEDLPY